MIKKNNQCGVTFVEVMVTMAILSFGLVLLYKAFFVSLDAMNHLTHRLYALALIDNRIAFMQKVFEEKGDIPLQMQQPVDRVLFDQRPVDFRTQTDVRSVENLNNVYQLDIALFWQERGRDIRISRTTYIGKHDSRQKN
ncbi:MAG: prepilin-type N-terminal cleavage/methylation domain-containing protein [Candidatus Omnitrophota bacterium]